MDARDRRDVALCFTFGTLAVAALVTTSPWLAAGAVAAATVGIVRDRLAERRQQA